MAQQGVEKVGLDKHNFARTGRMALYGGGMSDAPFFTCPWLMDSLVPQLFSALQPPRGSNSYRIGSTWQTPTLPSPRGS